MESSYADRGARVTNHPPSRRAGQANPPRHQDRACDHSIVAVRAARNMPSAGPSARPSGRRPSEPRHEAGCNAPQRIHRAASKGWAKKPNKIVRATYQSSPCVRPIGRRNTVEPTNETSKSTRFESQQHYADNCCQLRSEPELTANVLGKTSRTITKWTVDQISRLDQSIRKIGGPFRALFDGYWRKTKGAEGE